ncbi:MAG: hypothetical protein ABJF01_20265 [bacterium]
MRIVSIAFMFVALGPMRAAAQNVPFIAGEITGGAGAHTTQTQHLYYIGEHNEFWRAATTIRLGSAGSVRPTLTIEHSTGCGFGWGCGHSLNCPVGPDGRCESTFDDAEGTAIAAGVGGALGNRVLGGIAAGVAQYTKWSRYVDANVSLRLIPHLAVVGDVRHIVWTDDRGDRVSFSPASVGLRIF